MGRGRARAVVCASAVLALLAAGCGAESHPNDQRPQVPLRVSVTITPKAITVQPAAVGIGPARTQQIPQNENHAQPQIKDDDGPLTVSIVIANQTRTDSKLEIRGPRDVSSVAIPPGSPATLQTALPDRHLHDRRRRRPRRPPRQTRRSALSAPPPRTTSSFPSRFSPLQAAFQNERLRLGGLSLSMGDDRRPRNRRRPARRRARLPGRLAPRGAGRAARFRRRRAGGRLARGRRLAAQPDPGQRRGPQARRQDRGGVAGQAPGGDRQSARRRSRGWPSASPRVRRRSKPRFAAAARPTCRPGPCWSRWARPSATSTPRPPA